MSAAREPGTGAEGALRLEVGWDGEAVQTVRVASTRPLAVRRLLEGIEPAEMLRRVSLLYAVCAEAQTAAATAAIAAARGQDLAPSEARASELRVAGESAHEHLFHVLVGLPGAIGGATDSHGLSPLSRMLSAMREAPAEWGACPVVLREALTERVFGMAAAEWPEMDAPEELDRWLDTGGFRRRCCAACASGTGPPRPSSDAARARRNAGRIVPGWNPIRCSRTGRAAGASDRGLRRTGGAVCRRRPRHQAQRCSHACSPGSWPRRSAVDRATRIGRRHPEDRFSRCVREPASMGQCARAAVHDADQLRPDCAAYGGTTQEFPPRGALPSGWEMRVPDRASWNGGRGRSPLPVRAFRGGSRCGMHELSLAEGADRRGAAREQASRA